MGTCPTCGTNYKSNELLCPQDGTVLDADAPPELNQIGRVLDSKYRTETFISSGGMGAVYRGTHVLLGRPVAIKVIRPELVSSPDIVRRFQREARVVLHLSHPNIVSVYDLGQTADGMLYLAMEFVDGSNLKDVIKTSGPMEPNRIVSILLQIVSALSVAHKRHVVHRDLKPHNIMLTTDPDGQEIAKLLDFGIAKSFDDATTQLTATGAPLGTPLYMPPEQVMGKQVDGRSDLYSLGVITYEMLVGEVPFNDPSGSAVLVKHMTMAPEPPSRRRPDLRIDPVLESIALRCLEKDPARRFQSAEELGAALTRMREEAAVTRVKGATPVDAPATVARSSSIPSPEKIPTPVTGPATIPEPHIISPATIPASGTAPPLASRGTVSSEAASPRQVPAAPAPSKRLAPALAAVILALLAGAVYWSFTRSGADVNSSRPADPAAGPSAASVPQVVATPEEREPAASSASTSPSSSGSGAPTPEPKEPVAPLNSAAAAPNSIASAPSIVGVPPVVDPNLQNGQQTNSPARRPPVKGSASRPATAGTLAGQPPATKSSGEGDSPSSARPPSDVKGASRSSSEETGPITPGAAASPQALDHLTQAAESLNKLAGISEPARSRIGELRLKVAQLHDSYRRGGSATISRETGGVNSRTTIRSDSTWTPQIVEIDRIISQLLRPVPGVDGRFESGIDLKSADIIRDARKHLIAFATAAM